jgi:hypothetical protein
LKEQPVVPGENYINEDINQEGSKNKLAITIEFPCKLYP